MVAGAAFLVAFGLAGWQNGRVIALVNAPLPGGLEPITLGPSEPFMTTLKLSAYAALLLALPVLLYQAYAFFVPALAPRQRRMAGLLLLAVPALFLAGVAFSYLVVLTPALHFLLNFNATSSTRSCGRATTTASRRSRWSPWGSASRCRSASWCSRGSGVVSVDQLRGSRRYAIVAIAVLAALLPTLDPVTLCLEMLPLLVLYEAGNQLSQVFESQSDVLCRTRQPLPRLICLSRPSEGKVVHDRRRRTACRTSSPSRHLISTRWTRMGRFARPGPLRPATLALSSSARPPSAADR